jgi:adenine-specific DNA-methyltransferase
VLKVLRETYLGKVKMIYIDPPYNTGNDFVYNDDFTSSYDEFAESCKVFDENGNLTFDPKANNESNGRFHTDWLNMIYPRLKVARDLLTDDGLIFISLNDIEIENLRKICDEIFGEQNFIADLIWANKEGGGSSDSKLFRIKHEHICCYSKCIDKITIVGNPISNAERYKGSDEYESERGKYYLQKLGMGSIQYSSSLDYAIMAPDGTEIYPKDNNNGKKACWRWSKEKFIRNQQLGFVEIKRDSANMWTVYTKQYMNCDNDGKIIIRSQRPMGIIEEFSSTQAAKLLENMGLGSYFNYSKPIELMRYLISKIDGTNFTVLDFFSGSATTAHAVMKLNAEDGGHRKFIMVQLPEVTDEKSEARKAGYNTICEIGKERIRRAGRKIKEEAGLPGQDLDIGFRVLKLAESNMEDVFYAPDKISEGSLFVDNVKEGRTSEDLLFQVMLQLGIELSSPIEKKQINGKEVFSVRDGFLMATFDKNVDEATITEIAQSEPVYFVMRDASAANDNVLDNFEQLFRHYSPETIRRIL